MTKTKMLKVIEPAGTETKIVTRVLSIANIQGDIDLILGNDVFSTVFGENGRSELQIVVSARLRMKPAIAAALAQALQDQINLAAVPTEKAN